MVYLSEKEMEDILVNNLDFIEKGLTLVERQKRIILEGRLDLICKDQWGNYVIIELKLHADQKVITQLYSYEFAVRKHYNISPLSSIRKIVACFSYSSNYPYFSTLAEIKTIVFNKEALLSTGDIFFFNLPFQAQVLISLLFTDQREYSLDEIASKMEMTNSELKHLINYISYFIPIEVSEMGLGNFTYNWPKGFRYKYESKIWPLA